MARTKKTRKKTRQKTDPKKRNQVKHDQSYKRLFSHPSMVEDLLRGFVQEDWIKQLDFATLEVFKDSFVADDLIERHDDIIWRVRWKSGKWLYVYLLLEFQSSIDNFMAVRIMVYIGLLYQYLIDTEELTAKDKLPPVLPLVIYNGGQRWKAAQDISELVAQVPGGLEKYRPHLRYFLIDEGKYENLDTLPLQNLVTAIIRLENTRTLENEQAVAEAIGNVLNVLMDLLKGSEFVQLRRDIVTWLLRVLLPKNVPNVEIPEVVELQEMKTMLYERMQNWYRTAEANGEARGETRGKAEILVHMLEKKFGVLPASLRTRIDHLDSEALLKCSEQFLTAKTVQDVFKAS
jgi:predicted transposase YdaD